MNEFFNIPEAPLEKIYFIKSMDKMVPKLLFNLRIFKFFFNRDIRLPNYQFLLLTMTKSKTFVYANVYLKKCFNNPGVVSSMFLHNSKVIDIDCSLLWQPKTTALWKYIFYFSNFLNFHVPKFSLGIIFSHYLLLLKQLNWASKIRS